MFLKLDKLFKKDNVLLFFVLSVSALFRFYNYQGFQYWSGDEEVMTATIRHIIWDRSPTLLVQNSNLAFGLGPFYHYMLTPFYAITNFNLVLLQSIGSFLGIGTTYLIYLAGKNLKNTTFGLVSAFVYCSSFLISLFDRRVVHLTLAPILAAFTALCLAKLIKGDKKYLSLLAIPIGFSFHMDPSLTVLTISIILSLIIFRISVFNKQGFYALLILLFFASPIFLAEIRYHGAVSGPVVKSLTRPLRGESVASVDFRYFTASDFINIYSRTIFTRPSKFIEENFCYCTFYPSPLFTPYVQIFGASSLAFIVWAIYKIKNNKQKDIVIVFIMLISFVAGIILFTGLFKGNFYQHYFLVFFPTFSLILGLFYYEILKRKKPIFFFLLIIYFMVNFYSLLNSEIKYPLYRKIDLVKNVVNALGSSDFSLKSSDNPYIQGGGWTELFTLQRKAPATSYWYEYWDWIYRAYSLFPRQLSTEVPTKIVMVRKTNDLELSFPVIYKSTYKDISVEILDSQNQNK